jgi:hypothetical protein
MIHDERAMDSGSPQQGTAVASDRPPTLAARSRVEVNGQSTCSWTDCLASTGKPSWVERCQRKEAHCKTHCMLAGNCHLSCKQHFALLSHREKEKVLLWAEEASDGKPTESNDNSKESTAPEGDEDVEIITQKLHSTRGSRKAKKAEEKSTKDTAVDDEVLAGLAERLAPMIMEVLRDDSNREIQVTQSRRTNEKSKKTASKRSRQLDSHQSEKEGSDDEEGSGEANESKARHKKQKFSVFDSSEEDEDSEEEDSDDSQGSSEEERRETMRARRRLQVLLNKAKARRLKASKVSDEHKHSIFTAALPSEQGLAKEDPGYITPIVFNKEQFARLTVGMFESQDESDDELLNKELELNLLREVSKKKKLLNCLESMDSLQRVLGAKLGSWQKKLIMLGLSIDQFRRWTNIRMNLIQIACSIARDYDNANAGLFYYNLYAQAINNGAIKYELDMNRLLAKHKESLEKVRSEFRGGRAERELRSKPTTKNKKRCFICQQLGHLQAQCPSKAEEQTEAKNPKRTVKKKKSVKLESEK